MRRGELLGLRWCDLTESVIRVRQTIVLVDNKLVLSTPKTDKGQRAVRHREPGRAGGLADAPRTPRS